MHKRNHHSISSLLLLLWTPFILFAQNTSVYNGTLQEIYFGRLPSAKSEAMGRCGVAGGEEVYTIFFNPAGTSVVEGISLAGSYASPYYLLENADYYFAGASVNLRRVGTFGIGWYRMNYETSQQIPNVNDHFTSFLILNYSFRPMKDFSVGININFVRSKYAGPQFSFDAKSYPLDIGILRIFKLPNHRRTEHIFALGASCFNLNHAKISYITEEQKNALPVIFRAGASYRMTYHNENLMKNVNTMDILFIAEYQNLFNSKYRNGLKCGLDISFFDLFAFRLGYYRETLDDYGYSINKKILDDITYGLGIQIPLHKITNGRLKLNIRFDITTLRQPTYSRTSFYIGDFSVYSLSVNWTK
ncbi:MAG: hypothetical protein ABIL68_09215 [bacterium]